MTINFPYFASFSLSLVGDYSRDNLGLPSTAFFPKWNLAPTEKCSYREDHETLHILAREAFLIDVEEILKQKSPAHRCIMYLCSVLNKLQDFYFNNVKINTFSFHILK